jgi:hypothetical protein
VGDFALDSAVLDESQTVSKARPAMSEKLFGDGFWQVNEWADSIKPRTPQQRRKIEKEDERWGRHEKLHFFDTLEDAKSFLIERAKTRLEEAQRIVVNCEKRLKKCRKYGDPQ